MCHLSTCSAPSPSPKGHISPCCRVGRCQPLLGGSHCWWQQRQAGGVVLGSSRGSWHSWPSPVLSRCESAGGHREWPDAAGSKWAGQGLQPHQQAAIPADGCPRGPQRPRDNIRCSSPAFTPSFTCSATSPEWFQLRPNLLTGARGKLPGEMEMVYSGIKLVKSAFKRVCSLHLLTALHLQSPLAGKARCRIQGRWPSKGHSHSLSGQRPLLLGLALADRAMIHGFRFPVQTTDGLGLSQVL